MLEDSILRDVGHLRSRSGLRQQRPAACFIAKPERNHRLSLRRHQNGVSLIELVLATALGVIVVVSLSITLPTVSKNIIMNQQRWIAVRIANTQIQTVKSQPYDFLTTTDVSEPGSFPPWNPNCDCTAADFTVLDSTTTQVGAVVLTQATCVNYVTSAWAPQCATSGDTGYKHIMVRVWWSLGSSTSEVTQESLTTRY
jgi:hypothetical protein